MMWLYILIPLVIILIVILRHFFPKCKYGVSSCKNGSYICKNCRNDSAKKFAEKYPEKNKKLLAEERRRNTRKCAKKNCNKWFTSVKTHRKYCAKHKTTRK